MARWRHSTNSERWFKRYRVGLQNFTRLHYLPPTISVSIFGELKLRFPLCSRILCWIQMGIFCLFLPGGSIKITNGTPARNLHQRSNMSFEWRTLFHKPFVFVGCHECLSV